MQAYPDIPADTSSRELYVRMPDPLVSSTRALPAWGRVFFLAEGVLDGRVDLPQATADALRDWLAAREADVLQDALARLESDARAARNRGMAVYRRGHLMGYSPEQRKAERARGARILRQTERYVATVRDCVLSFDDYDRLWPREVARWVEAAKLRVPDLYFGPLCQICRQRSDGPKCLRCKKLDAVAASV